MKEERIPGQRAIDDPPRPQRRTRENSVQDFQDEIDKIEENLGRLMSHIKSGNFTPDYLDRNIGILRDTSDNLNGYSFDTQKTENGMTLNFVSESFRFPVQVGNLVWK
ncbi:hypothetical protein C6496_06890 [Candidatus Poribacteria bacterium]|nr:MAG: hypothetical protein C6496_06890 [Candidatus Poribacteria bacterium]